MLSFLVFDQWLPSSLLASAHRLTLVHAGAPKQDGAPRFSWYSPGQGRHVSRLAAEQAEIGQAYIDNLVSRLRAILEFEPVGFEWWTNHDNTLPWHIDRDETLFRQSGEMRHPIWSTVLYTSVDLRSRGGDLVIIADDSAPAPYNEDLTGAEVPHRVDRIAPRTNRLVVFRRGLRHRIDPFEGRRSSLAMNIWDVTPKEFEGFKDSRYILPIS